jgi:hypothetical protein
LSSFFMLPVVGDVKPFDLLAVLLFVLKIRHGIALQRVDLAFFVFIACCFASLGAATVVVESSLLQSLRYLIFFLLARLSFDANEHALLAQGLRASILLNCVWIVIDLAQYYTVGDCESLNVSVFPWVVDVTTHRYPIEFLGCPILRPTGFTWDPGGLFPIMLVTAHAFKAHGLTALTALFSVVAVSRTAILTALGLFVGRRAPRLAWLAVLMGLLVIPFVALVYSDELLRDFEDGTLRHLTYPGLALLGVFENPRYLLLGDGIRGGASMFLTMNHPVLNGFFSIDDLLSGTARNLVIESIWVNQLTGAGAIGFTAYMVWLIRGLRDKPAVLIGLMIAGTYYTFDSSMFCFMVPFLMTLKRPTTPAVPAHPAMPQRLAPT